MFHWKSIPQTVIAPRAASLRLFRLRDGRLIAAAETARGIRVYTTADDGQSWADAGPGSFTPDLVSANPEFFEMPDGRILLAHRAIGKRENGFYTSLRVNVCEDPGGMNFRPHSVVTEYTEPDGGFRGVWEPCLGILNGVLTCFYANDATSVTPQQNIEYKQWDGAQWSNRTVVCDGVQHDSRDGMPVWIPLRAGGYALVIEATCRRREPGRHPFVIQLLFSPDGVRWSDPVDIFRPGTDGSKAGAPWIAELEDGRLVVSFQTDEDSETKGDCTSVMKTMISDGSPAWELHTEKFGPAETVFEVPEGSGALWAAVYTDGRELFASAGTGDGAVMKRAAIEKIHESEKRSNL
ncbi:MAG: exo-alpha-sialidase [Clostridia bacterium]|nr:exo-alpha-sialidase [Clostridia bacterium]